MIRCQVLGGAVVRRDDRREIARPQLVDRGNRDPARRDFRLPDRDGAIEHDDDEPSFFPGGLIGRDVARHVVRPRGVAPL